MNTSHLPPDSLWQSLEFRAYMAATGCFQFAFSMQQLLTSWLFIKVLNTSAQHVGVAQAMIGLPGLLLLLWGGANADRVDGRHLVLRVYAAMALPSLVLAALVGLHNVTFWVVTGWALCIAVCNAVGSPALQAMLNRICGAQVQQGVTTSTAIGFLVQICGIALAGQIQSLHAPSILIVQSIVTLIGAYWISRLAPAPIAMPLNAPLTAFSKTFLTTFSTTISNIKEGLGVVARDHIILHILALNFLSMIFNAGAFAMVFPFIMLKAYHGDAHFLAVMMIVFFGGAMVSNIILLRYMPILRTGRLFLIMQLTRIIILLGLWIQPAASVLALFTFLWGLNMGVTSTMSRAIVQERAEAAYRGRVLSVLNIGFLGAQPFAALLFGHIVDAFGPLNALLPGVAASVIIFVYGTAATRVWSYESPTLSRQP